MSGEAQFMAGTIIAVMLAIPGFVAAKRIVRKRQSQKVARDGRGYQAGGDINIKNEK